MRRPWALAMQEALYGADGFWLRERPAEHFRTSVVAATQVYAEAVSALAARVDEALGRPDPFDLVDVGAGRGELLSAVAALPGLPARWRLTAVERAPDPEVGLTWSPTVPQLTGLLLANEWLDDVPVEVLFDGVVVEVDDDGIESLGGPAPSEQLAWQQRWWPYGRRVEVGLERDRAWAAAVGQVTRGVAVAVDYSHVFGARTLGARGTAWGDRRPTLTGYRDGRQVPPLPDGSCNLTARVAIDACHAAGGGGALLTQREALLDLGVDATAPPRTLAADDPRGYLARLQRATASAELLDPRGLGSFAWLVRAVDVPPPFADAGEWPMA